jgi:hypothetical protein
MPYPHEHACRLREPSDMEPGSFRSLAREHGSRTYRVIMGKLWGEAGRASPLVEQAYRYPVDSWTVAEAEAHCRAHGGVLFEPARASER